MSKQVKTVGKFRLWALISALVILAGIVLGIFLGFNADPTVSDVKTLTIEVDSVVSISDVKTEKVKEIAERELDKAGLKDIYTLHGKLSGNSESELIYVFSAEADEEKVTKAKAGVETALNEAKSQEGNELYGAFFYVMAGSEKASAVLSAGYIWRGILAAAAILLFEFVYVAIRYKLNMGVTAAATSFVSILLTLALIVLFRIPVTGSVIYVAAFALLYSALLSMIIFNRMRENFKTDEYKDMPAQEAIATSVPVKVILAFAIVGAAALILVGAIAAANVRWFALAALTALVSGTYAALLFLPAMYLPLKKISDKKAAERARYDYKKPEKSEKSKKDEKPAPAKDAGSAAGSQKAGD